MQCAAEASIVECESGVLFPVSVEEEDGEGGAFAFEA